MNGLSELNRDRYLVARAVESAHIEDPLQAFEHAWEMVASRKAKAAELVLMTSKYPSGKLSKVWSPLLLDGEKVHLDSPQAEQLSEALQAFIEDISTRDGEYENLLDRLTKQEPPDYVHNESYWDARSWIAPTANPNIVLGVQSATDDRGELWRRFYIAAKPFNLKEFLVRGIQNWGEMVSSQGVPMRPW